MFCHWRYVLDNLFGPVRSVSALGAIHIPERIGEDGEPYAVTAEDAAYATFEIEDGPIVQMNSSWCVRVDRDELFELQVDGTEGSAVAGLRECRIQPAAATPMPVWNPDIPSPIDHRAAWQRVPDRGEHDNGFKVQWEKFLRHVAFDEPFPWDFLEAAKGIQLAELGMRSWERAPLRRGPGARAVSVDDDDARPPRARTARSRPYTPGAPSPYDDAARTRRAPAVRSPPPTWSPTRSRPATPAAPRSSTGRRRSRSAATCGRTGSASPRRWTPRSAAWAWTGPRRRS